MNSRISQFGVTYAGAVGAGLASALLFSLVAQGTLFALALAYLSPLPIMIAMLGFGWAAGLVASALATVAVIAVALVHQGEGASAAALGPAALSGLTFALSLGLPALSLSYLAALSRPKDAASWSVASGAGRSFTRDAYPLERLLAYGVALAASIVVAATIVVSVRQGGFETALDRAEAALSSVLEDLAGQTQIAHGDLGSLARLLVLAAPPVAAASTLLMLMLNLWAAARVAEVSGRLPRPWPDIPHELRLSRIYAPVFLAAIAVSFVGGLPGVITAIVAAALGMGFALAGLASIHDLSRGLKQRTLLLGLVYACLALLMPWPLIAFALVGLAESIFALRDRKKNSVPPKGGSTKT